MAELQEAATLCGTGKGFGGDPVSLSFRRANAHRQNSLRDPGEWTRLAVLGNLHTSTLLFGRFGRLASCQAHLRSHSGHKRPGWRLSHVPTAPKFTMKRATNFWDAGQLVPALDA